MRRHLRWIAVVVALAALGIGFGTWALVRRDGSPLPQISAYSQGTTVRVDPYLYCNVIDLNDCVRGGAQGDLPVGARSPVQLSVPTSISQAPWRLIRVYQDEQNSVTTAYRPGAQLAVTIPTVDPQRGRLVGLVVQLITLVQDQDGELRDLPHAEWSVRLDWP